jgi:hypothetical protein
MPWADTLPTTIAECVEWQNLFSKPALVLVDNQGKHPDIKGFEWGEKSTGDEPF